MKTTKKVLQILLPLVLLLTVLASCGGKEEIPWQKTTAKTSATTKSTPRAETTAATTAATTPPTEMTFDGYEFIIAGERGNNVGTFFVTSATNAMTNQLIRTYEALEDEHDIVITFADAGYDTVVANAVANKATGDFINFRHQYWIPLAVKGYIKPLNTDKIKAAGLDVSDPEQVDIYMTNASKLLDGENVWAFSVSGRYFSAPWGHALAFNKQLCAEAGYPAEDIYQMVRDRTWTWDKFEEICRAVSDESTGIDGYQTLTNDTVEIASNIPINSLGNDGKWRTNADTDEFKTAVEWFNRIVNDRDVCVALDYEYGSGDRRNNFYAGNQGFMVLWCGDFGFENGKCNTSMPDDYGYIPFPMGPDATEYSHVIPDLYGFSLETANKEVETSAYIMGRLASVLNDPDEYATFARGFMRDDESVEMILEYLLPNTTFNTARLSSDTRQVVKDMVPYFLHLENTDGVSSVFGRRMQKEIDKLFGYETDQTPAPSYVYLNGADEMSLKDAYSLLKNDKVDLAEELGYVIHIDGDILSGTEKWEEFVHLTKEGTPAVIRGADFTRPTGYSDPLVRVYDVRYDGEFYWYDSVSKSASSEEGYLYLNLWEVVSSHEATKYEKLYRYILSFQSESSSYVGYRTVWSDYVYKEQYKDMDATYGR
ncbi:MAG: extracellular solute-binding protein [Clostridia bacterium]|nr:extracellular solute-binding protein [Clostridia bacterium]